jgi:predicted NUDIX family NTP pyrophosphohydrolase
MAELLRPYLDITQGTQSRYYLFLAPSLLIGRYLTWASFTTQASRKLRATHLKTNRRPASSAGILMYRQAGSELEVLLVHPGGPYWRHKDDGAWSIPKGEMNDGEHAEIAARREFLEETGIAVTGPLEPLGDIRQRGGKRVTAFAVEGDLDVDAMKSNTFGMEWPPKGGKLQSFPEIDRAAWFDLPAAHVKMLESQRPLLDRLVELVDRGAIPAP